MTTENVSEQKNFNPLRVVIPALLSVLAISLGANWYARKVSMPRYCDSRPETLQLLKKIITEERPAGDETRRPYLVAAKLLFLVPREADEETAPYLERLGQHLRARCG